MELRPASAGYELQESKIPIVLAMRTLGSLRPHEETVKEEFAMLLRSIRADQVLRHPIIADENSGVVLDGNHRLAVLKSLGCKVVPCALVNYGNRSILVERWFRTIGPARLDELWERLEKAGLDASIDDSIYADKLLEKREYYAVLEDGRRCLALRSPSPDPLQLARLGFKVETVARGEGFHIGYTDSRPGSLGPGSLLLSTIRLEKEEVVDVASRGELFPPKTTRHVIPSRPLGVKVPVEWLNMDSVGQAQEKLLGHLGRMKLIRLHEGTIVGSRRYQEEVFLFE